MKRGHVTGNKKERRGSQDWYRQIEAANIARIEAETGSQPTQHDLNTAHLAKMAADRQHQAETIQAINQTLARIDALVAALACSREMEV